MKPNNMATEERQSGARISGRVSVTRDDIVLDRARRSSNRFSLVRLGSQLNAMPSEDKFAKVRAMRNQGQSPVMNRGSARIDLDKLSAELQKQEQTFDLIEYAKENFKFTSRGSMRGKGKQIPLETLIEWSPNVLTQSLHGMSHPTLEKQAIQANKHILGYMGDYTDKKIQTATKHLYELLNIGIINSPEELRDEIYCQIIKQLRSNPREGSCQKGWILMAICTGSFPPSQFLESYLTTFLQNAAAAPSYKGVDIYAKYAELRLKKSIAYGPRRQVPCGIEIDCVAHRKPVPITINLINGTEHIFEAETWTTAGDLKERIRETLTIIDDTPFALYEVSTGASDVDSERVIEDDEKILDTIATWEAERLASKEPSNPLNKFYYKIRLFLDIDDEDTSAIELAYWQATHDVTDSRYPVTELDLIKLVALEAQEKFGDYRNGMDVFGGQFQAYLPNKYSGRDAAQVAQLKKLIMERYQQLRGIDKLEAKKQYLAYVKEWQVYGAQSFFVEPLNNPALPKMVILAVNGRGVLTIDPKSKQVLDEYPWNDIMTWGKSPENFCIVHGNYLKQTKLWFKPTTSDENEILYDLVEAYGSHKRGITTV